MNKSRPPAKARFNGGEGPAPGGGGARGGAGCFPRRTFAGPVSGAVFLFAGRRGVGVGALRYGEFVRCVIGKKKNRGGKRGQGGKRFRGRNPCRGGFYKRLLFWGPP